MPFREKFLTFRLLQCIAGPLDSSLHFKTKHCSFKPHFFNVNLVASLCRHSELIERTLLFWICDVSCHFWCFMTSCGACSVWAVPARTISWQWLSHQGLVSVRPWAWKGQEAPHLWETDLPTLDTSQRSWMWFLPFCYSLIQADPESIPEGPCKISCLAGRWEQQYLP